MTGPGWGVDRTAAEEEPAAGALRRGRRIAVAVGVLLAAGAAGAAVLGWGPFEAGTITADRLAGGWEGPEGERLEFRADGTFCARAFPIDQAPAQPVDSCGRWSFSEDGETDQGIDLDFDRPSYALIGMVRVSGEDGAGGLYVRWDIDDASGRLELRRVPAG
ncbi:hypothetical protein ACFVU3_20815 [Streptomyces sp. NPDC058052]|uniref:hypothetical protein n=1 Tax=Streptomyces sp. NPDC058052 TaxID=3346316 RepID=UPI0036E83CE9